MGQRFVLLLAVGDTGVGVQEMPPFQFIFQGGIQGFAVALSMGALPDIDSGFYRPIVGRAGFEAPRVCVALDFSGVL